MGLRLLFCVALAGIAGVAPAQAQAQDWPAPFDPTQVLTLGLEMAPSDWDTIRHDTTNEIEVPAMFRATATRARSWCRCGASRAARCRRRATRSRSA